MRLSELRRELLAKIDSIDARIIIRLVTGLDDVHQITESNNEIDDGIRDKALELLSMRLSGMPMAYIMGEKEFYG